MGRVKDAWLTLLGRSDVQIRAHGQMARYEAEWLMICNSIQLALTDLNLHTDKYRKQEERAAKRASATTTPAAPATQVAASSLSPKEALRSRLRAEGKLGVPPSRVNGGNADTGEPRA